MASKKVCNYQMVHAKLEKKAIIEIKYLKMYNKLLSDLYEIKEMYIDWQLFIKTRCLTCKPLQFNSSKRKAMAWINLVQQWT